MRTADAPDRGEQQQTETMRLVIVGATGGIGRHLLEQALAAGHEVTAVVRDSSGLSAPVPAVTIDLSAPDEAVLRSAVAGADAVLSTLGPRRRAETGIVSRGTRALVAAMAATGGGRLVVASGAGVSTVPTPGRPHPPRREPGAGFLNRHVNTPLARLLIGQHFVDVAVMEDLLRSSDLRWTAVRLPLLVDAPARGTWRTAVERNVRRGFRIARADAATFMLQTLGRPDSIGRAIAIAW